MFLIEPLVSKYFPAQIWPHRNSIVLDLKVYSAAEDIVDTAEVRRDSYGKAGARNFIYSLQVGIVCVCVAACVCLFYPGAVIRVLSLHERAIIRVTVETLKLAVPLENFSNLTVDMLIVTWSIWHFAVHLFCPNGFTFLPIGCGYNMTNNSLIIFQNVKTVLWVFL